MKPDNAFFTLLEGFEKFVSCPYRDGGGVPTIGIGSTRYPNGKRVTMLDKCITRDQAIEIVKATIVDYVNAVNRLDGKINQNQFNALLSFCYDIGTAGFLSSTLLKIALANPNDPRIRDQFMRWNKDNGKEVKGLAIRRRTEANLYFKQ